MKKGAFLKLYATRLAFFLAVAALLLFISASLTQSTAWRVFLLIVTAFLLLAGGILLFLSSQRFCGVHYFLFDRRRKKSEPREELSAETVFDGIAYYLRPFLEDPLSLWHEIPKPLRLQLEGEPQFRPLVAFYMLYLLSGCDEDKAFEHFLKADERTITFVCAAIGEGGDQEMADYVYHLKKRGDRDRICVFFKRNGAVFAARALRFVDRHFEEFYVKKQRLTK